MYFLCHLKLKARSHMLPNTQNIWGGSVSTAPFFFYHNTHRFHSKLMFHSARDSQNPVSAPKSLQSLLLLSPSFALILLNGAFEKRVEGIKSFFDCRDLFQGFAKIPSPPHTLSDPVLSCPLLEPSDPELPQKPWDCSRCPAHGRTAELHMPPFSSTSPPPSLVSIACSC